jgi:hypothetical protein
MADLRGVGVLKEQYGRKLRELFDAQVAGNDEAIVLKQDLVAAIDAKLPELLELGKNIGDDGEAFIRALRNLDGDRHRLGWPSVLKHFAAEGLAAQPDIEAITMASANWHKSSRSSSKGGRGAGSLRVSGARPLSEPKTQAGTISSVRVHHYLKRLKRDLLQLSEANVSKLQPQQRLGMHKRELLQKMSMKMLEREFEKLGDPALGRIGLNGFCAALNGFLAPDQEGLWDDAMEHLHQIFNGNFRKLTHGLFREQRETTTTSKFGFVQVKADALPRKQVSEGIGPLSLGEYRKKFHLKTDLVLPERWRYPHCQTSVRAPGIYSSPHAPPDSRPPVHRPFRLQNDPPFWAGTLETAGVGACVWLQ